MEISFIRNKLIKIVSMILVTAIILGTGAFAVASSAWTPTMPLPSRRLTSNELNAWRQQYDITGISPIELEILRLTNIEREKAKVAPLGLHPNLFRAARFKSQEMRDLDYYDHGSPVYGGFTGIMSLFATTSFVSVGENLHTSGGT